MTLQATRQRRRSRWEQLSDAIIYEDDGCDVSPKCTACPLPVCRYEVRGGLRAIQNMARDTKMRKMRVAGASHDEIAEAFSVSRRTVFRVLLAGGKS